MLSRLPENDFPVPGKWLPGSRKMTSRFPEMTFCFQGNWLPGSWKMISRFPGKWLLVSRKMTSWFPENDFPVPGKWFPGFQQMTFPYGKWLSCSQKMTSQLLIDNSTSALVAVTIANPDWSFVDVWNCWQLACQAIMTVEASPLKLKPVTVTFRLQWQIVSP